MKDSLRLHKLARLSQIGHKQVRHYGARGCFVFCFSHKGKKLEATICDTQGIICGVYNPQSCSTVEIALFAQVIDRKISKAFAGIRGKAIQFSLERDYPRKAWQAFS